MKMIVNATIWKARNGEIFETYDACAKYEYECIKNEIASLFLVPYMKDSYKVTEMGASLMAETILKNKKEIEALFGAINELNDGYMKGK